MSPPILTNTIMKQYKIYELIADVVESYEGEKLAQPQRIAEFVRPFFGKKINAIEQTYAIFLDVGLNPLGVLLIGQGGVSATYVDPKLVFMAAVSSCASSVILCHNHPSGNLNASNADVDITIRIGKGLNTLGINLLDHLIITQSGHTSLRESNLIDFNQNS